MSTPATLADLLTRATPARPAVILEDKTTTTYQGLAEQIESLASALAQSGLQAGDRVAIVLPNGLEYLACFLAVTRARLVAAPLNSAYKAEEFRFYLEDAGARAVITVPEAHPVQAVARELGLPLWSADRDSSGRVRLQGEKLPASGKTATLPQPDDVALFLHTSGTTSRPK